MAQQSNIHSLAREQNFTISGRQITAKCWGNPVLKPVLALHGWLDNAGSFDKLAPLLPEFYLVAVDLPGHGLSDHKSSDHVLHILDFVVDMIRLTREMGWQHFSVIGHSLGGAIGSLIAGTIPDQIKKLILIDALGPLTLPDEHAPMQLRLYLKETLGKMPSTPPRYADIDAAIQVRTAVNAMHVESARCIVSRGLKQLEDGQFAWRTDPKLLKPSAWMLTEAQTLSFLKEITAPTLIIRPEPGFPFAPDVIERRIQAVKHIEIIRIPGQHHVHLDAPESVAGHIIQFIHL